MTRARLWVPVAQRETCFDPAVEDAKGQWLERRATAPRWRRSWVTAAFVARICLLALQCRRLAPPVVQRSRSMRGSILPAVTVACRRLWQQPRFTAVVTLTLAIGLGANITVFTFVDSFLIAALPVAAPHQLVRVAESRDGGADTTSFPTYRDVRDYLAGSVDLAAHVQTEVLLGEGEAVRTGTAELVSGNYFRVMQLVPQRGRLLDDGDHRAELGHAVAVVSDRYWRSVLASAPGVIGQRLVINGASFEIVGVAPAGYDGTFAAHHVDVWVPIVMQGWVRPRGLSIERRTWGWLWMIGRMREGVRLDRVVSEVAQAADAQNRAFPPARPADGLALRATPASALAASDAEGLRPLLQAAFAFTALLFLATCANLAGIFHSRIAMRTRELAIRQSLGAGRGRLMFEWMVECGLLALLGGGVALLVGLAGARGLAGLDIPSELIGQVRLDAEVGWRVVVYALALSMLAAILFGAGAAWRAGRRAPVSALKAEGGTQAGGAMAARARRIAVTLQVASSVVLLVLANLLSTGLSRHLGSDPGFDAGRIGLLSLNLRQLRVPPGDWDALTERAMAVAGRTPGVTAVATAMRPPLGLGEDVQSVRIPGYTPPDGRPTVLVDFNLVSAGYFDVLGLAFRSGTVWPATVRDSPAVVVNETMARAYWPNGDAVGRSLRLGELTLAVSGVVEDSAYYEVNETPRAMLYLPAEARREGNFGLMIRTDGDPASVAAAVGRALSAADSRLAPGSVMSFEELRRVPLFPARLLATTTVIFSVVSVLLTIVGLYGVIAASVSDRTREIGVRLALGAAPTSVQAGVIRTALRLSLVGVLVGGTAAYGAATVMRGWLFAVSPFDPVAYGAVFVAIAAIAVVSAWLPARRAARVDPVAALR